jgi:calcium/calmodulin-dependent protein kinase (CaM kinase) II
MLGSEGAVVTYVRLVQRNGAGGPTTSACEETRVWQKIGGKWQQVHIHRSPLP